MRSLLLPLALVMMTLAGSTASAQPTNDLWHHGTHVTRNGATLVGTTVGATDDPSFAPRQTCDTSTTPVHSVWYIVAGRSSGAITISTEGSDFDTILSVHRQIGTNPRTERACNDDADGEPSTTLWSRIRYSVSGSDYLYIQVSGFGGETGNVRLTVNGSPVQGPPNAEFFATAIDGAPYFGSNVNSSSAIGIPRASCIATAEDSRKIALWVFRAPVAGRLTISTEGSTFDTVLSVLSSNGNGDVACNDDADGEPSTTRWSQISNFPVTAGQEVRIRVTGFRDPLSTIDNSEGAVVLTLSDGGSVADEPGATRASALRVFPASPNPVAASTALRFELAEQSEVRAEMFDVLGRSVGVLHQGTLAAGAHALTWTPMGLTPGTYVLRVTAGAEVQTQTLSVVR